MDLNASFLFASLFWGSVGAGYFIYGKKQDSMMPLTGGIAMIAVSYIISSWFWMSLICCGLAVGVYQLAKRGF